MAAIRGFLAAAKQQDLQAMGVLLGRRAGTGARSDGARRAEKRELIMVCYLKHDRYDIVGDAPNPGGTRAVVVSLTLGDLTRSANFEVVQGPGGALVRPRTSTLKSAPGRSACVATCADSSDRA